MRTRTSTRTGGECRSLVQTYRTDKRKHIVKNAHLYGRRLQCGGTVAPTQIRITSVPIPSMHLRTDTHYSYA
eukprot:scaffold587912_cov38-Prasinocladus_malaysianus.AAC.1